MAAAFIGLVIAILVEQKPGRLGLGTIVSAGEVAAWRVKWLVLPIALAVIWVGVRIVRSVRSNASLFIGLRAARLGVISAALVTLVIATLIGITIPVRLERRQWGIEAATYARGYALNRALIAYRDLHGTYPTDPEALRTLPDPDGSIAEALKFVDPAGYQANAQLAAASTKVKPLVVRGTALRGVSTTTNPEPAGVSFTSYQLRLPSDHRLFASDDDYLLIDGVIYKASEVTSTSSPSNRPRTP